MTKSWAQLVLGIWILLSPWILGFSSIAIMKWSNLIAGTILILIHVWAIFGKASPSAANERSETISNQ